MHMTGCEFVQKCMQALALLFIFFWDRVLCSPGLPQIYYVTKDNPEFLTLLLLCLPVPGYIYELSCLICNFYVLLILLI